MLSGKESNILLLYLMKKTLMKNKFKPKLDLLNECRIIRILQKENTNSSREKAHRPSKSPWSGAAFYVNNAPEKERGVPRLVINYKPLNKAL